MQIILPLLACVISKEVFEKDRFYLLFQMLGFIKWETSIYMESFTSGKYLKNYLVQIFHILNEAAVVQRGEGTVPRSHSNQHQSQQPPDPGEGVVWLITSIALCSVSCRNKITVLKIQRQTVYFLYKSFSSTLKNVIFLLIQFSKKLKMAYNEALAIKQGRKEWREGRREGEKKQEEEKERK